VRPGIIHPQPFRQNLLFRSTSAAPSAGCTSIFYVVMSGSCGGSRQRLACPERSRREERRSALRGPTSLVKTRNLGIPFSRAGFTVRTTNRTLSICKPASPGISDNSHAVSNAGAGGQKWRSAGDPEIVARFPLCLRHAIILYPRPPAGNTGGLLLAVPPEEPTLFRHPFACVRM
jgi:hypothetical protein